MYRFVNFKGFADASLPPNIASAAGWAYRMRSHQRFSA